MSMKFDRSNLTWSLWGGAGILSLVFLFPLVAPGDGPIRAGLGFDLKTLTYLFLLPALFFFIGQHTNRGAARDWPHLAILQGVYLAAMLLITKGQPGLTIAVFALFYLLCDLAGIYVGRSGKHPAH